MTMPSKKNQKTKKADTKVSERHKFALLKACYSGDLNTVKKMVQEGLSPNLIHDGTGGNPVRAAAKEGHLSVVRFLLDAGGDPDLSGTWKSDPPLSTPLEMASSNGHSEIVKMLLRRGADVSKKGYFTPIAAAASHGQPETLALLLRAGATFEPAIILLGARSANALVMNLLLKAGADPNFLNSDGESALHYAANQQSAEATKLLLEAGANPNVQSNIQKHAPLHIAAASGRMDVVKALLSGGADHELENSKGKTPEQWARFYNQREVAVLLRDWSKGKHNGF